jgi:hypothetical protein
MKQNDFIAVKFPQDTEKVYYAIVRKIFQNNEFECCFLHSGSIYIFKQYSGWLEVIKSTGLFKVGTRTNNVLRYTETDLLTYSVGNNVRVTFDDGKSYLGVIKSTSPKTEISFIHSANSYLFDADFVAYKPGSPYHGRKALEVKIYSAGINLFAGISETALSLSIKDGFGKPLRGEFDIVIKRTDNGQVLYNNTLSAEESNSNDRLDFSLNEGENMIVMVDFHPAFDPFLQYAISSSEIDRDTTISGSKTLMFKKETDLHLDIEIQNDTAQVTSTSSTEAINTKYKELTASSSHTFETHLEGEAGIKLFGIGGTITGGGGTIDTKESGVTDGSSDADSIGSSTSKTWNVYYPMGLKITPSF